jgi:hypothetical protein
LRLRPLDGLTEVISRLAAVDKTEDGPF